MASRDVAAGTDDLQPVGVLVIVNGDSWNSWPDVQALPVPGQVVPMLAVGEQAPSPDEGSPNDPGVSPIDFGPSAILALALGALGGLRRGRGFLLTCAATLSRILTGLPVFVSPGRLPLRREISRGLSFLRLSLGSFRLW
jgi:hypothetical protein